ncbi:MAG TPA: translocation/assembly module TamB domain-containing protein [Gemmatimonadaceae bacterium]
MTRRRLVAIISASLMLLVGLIAIGAVLAVTHTAWGRNRVRLVVASALRGALHGRGTFYIGTLEGNLLTGVTIDSVSIRDSEDSVFVASGPVRLHYDPRDLIDKRIRVSSIELDRPVIHLRRHADKRWNFQRIFPPGSNKARTRELRFGDYIVLSSVVIRDGTLVLTEPWDGADSLRGARRDSATRAALRDTAHEIRRSKEGLTQTRRFNHLQLEAPSVSVADPEQRGKVIQVGKLDVDIDDPPFKVRNATGPVTIVGDSVWLELKHFDLPGSTGQLSGKLWWGNDLPMRYDVRVVGDSVSLADIAWVHPTLPRTGGGRMKLTIRNESKNLHVLDYAVSDMDVRSNGSRLSGAMTFGVGGRVLQVKDVSVTVAPLDFDLLRTFNGGKFPVDWQGQFFGTVRGRGGPMDDFQVDDARLEFRDKHVPGAVTRLAAHGGLDILTPSSAKFLALHLDVGTLDLRTVRFLFPSFARLGGTISGTATLDSVWTDVRFSDADLSQHDGPGPATHVTGSGRITYGATTAFDVDLQASPLAFTTLARSYPGLRFRGSYSGPLRVQGTMANLKLATTLTGPAGQIGADGVFNLTPPVYGGRGTLRAHDLDVPMLLADTALPAARLTGQITGDVHGDSLSDLAGTASASVDSSRIDSIDVDHSTARLAFGGGRLRVDSLELETNLLRAAAHGAIGLSPLIRDSLFYVVTIDSLGALRPLLGLAVRDSAATAPADSGDTASNADALTGAFRGEGILSGSIDTLETHGSVTGHDLGYAANRVKGLTGTFAFRGLPHTPSGAMSGALDSVVVASIRLDSVAGSVILANRSSGRVSLVMVADSERGRYRAGAEVAFERDTDALRVTVDSAGATLTNHAWRLETPMRIVSDASGTRMDSIVVRSTSGGVMRMRGSFPKRDPIDGEISADSVALADIGTLLQTTHPLGGSATFDWRLGGVRANPVMHFAGRFTDMRYGALHLPYFTVAGDYANRRLHSALDLYRKDTVVLTATAVLPVDLALARVRTRLLADSLSGRVRADSVDLSLIESVAPQITSATGAASMQVDIGGTIAHPTLVGNIRVVNGALALPKIGIRLRAVKANIAFTPDSVRIAEFSVSNPGVSGSSASLSGGLFVPNWRQARTVGLNLALSARNFQAIDKRSLASLLVSGSLQLGGTVDRPVLEGDVSVVKGNLYISDVFQKQVVNLNDPEAYSIVDTNLVQNRGLLETSPLLDSIATHLRVPSLAVRIGDDVWLRSEEANIKLAGSMTLSKSGTQRVENGMLRVSRGTYRLDLGVVQRTFQVDSGSVTFFGDPHIPPDLSIWATYTVRQANRAIGEDVRLIAHITGTPSNPQLSLSSNERFALSNTEILSYLVFGQPSFTANADVTTNPVLQQVAAALLPSVGAVLERALADQIGFIDYVQVQTGSYSQSQTAGAGDPNAGASSFLAGTRIGLGKQVGERTFVTVNAGLCGLAGSQSGISFSQSLGLTVEHRLADGFVLQGSIEPSSAALQCRPGLTAIGSRPPQYGLDLFREWSF